MRWQRVKDFFHRGIDPLVALPGEWAARRALVDLPDGEYRLPVTVPYVPQFASANLIHAYIHEGLHGRDDPAWRDFGAADVETYHFWAPRVCALACIKMALGAFSSAQGLPSLWELVEQGLALDGYRAYDQAGRLVDEGWFYPALVRLGKRYGLAVTGRGYAGVSTICRLVREGWLVAPSVTPELGEYGSLREYGGHMVVVYGFRWARGRCTHVLLHNPSGREAALQADAVIPVARFRQAYAYRLVALRPDDSL